VLRGAVDRPRGRPPHEEGEQSMSEVHVEGGAGQPLGARRVPARSRRAGLARVAALLVLSVLLAACGAADARQGGHQPPRDGVAGLQLSGSFQGRQIALSDGAPTLLVGSSCMRRIGLDTGLCFGSRDIDATPVTIAFLNPGVVAQGTTVPVGPGDCRTPEGCADVRDVAVIEVQVGDRRQRARSGEITFGQIVPGSRYAGRMTLGFRAGQIGGTFDVVPRPEE
jgi:hypothetical protein